MIVMGVILLMVNLSIASGYERLLDRRVNCSRRRIDLLLEVFVFPALSFYDS